jgi:hypothetical protein
MRSTLAFLLPIPHSLFPVFPQILVKPPRSRKTHSTPITTRLFNFRKSGFNYYPAWYSGYREQEKKPPAMAAFSFNPKGDLNMQKSRLNMLRIKTLRPKVWGWGSTEPSPAQPTQRDLPAESPSNSCPSSQQSPHRIVREPSSSESPPFRSASSFHPSDS